MYTCIRLGLEMEGIKIYKVRTSLGSYKSQVDSNMYG